jgi:hypothetical protein
MAVRYLFGGGAADYAVTAGSGSTMVLQPGVAVTFWNAQVGGTQYTDLSSDPDGLTAVTGTTTSTGSGGITAGAILSVYGPPGVLAMWASAAGGPRVLVLSVALADAVASAVAGVAVGATALTGHTTAVNPHNIGSGDLTDSALGDPATRADGDVPTWNELLQKWLSVPAPSSSGGGTAQPVPGPWIDVTPGTGMAHGTVHCSTRLEADGATVRIRGTLVGTATSGTTLGTIAAAHCPSGSLTGGIRWSGGSGAVTITSGGLISVGSGITASTVWFDFITYPIGSRPDTPVLKVGAAVAPYPASGHTLQQSYDAWVSACGAVDFLRVYLNPSQSSVAALGTTWPVPGETSDWASRGCVLSIKFDMTALAAGSYDAKLTTLLGGYTGQWLKICPYHEPEDNVESGSMLASTWRAGVAHLVSLVATIGNPKVKVWPILMGYTWDPVSGRDPEDYWVPGVEGYAVDQYNLPSARHDSTTWKNAPVLMDAFTAWADAKGVQKGWTEVGCAPDFADSTRRPNWITTSYAYAVAHGYALFSWFDETGPKGDWQIRQAIHRAVYWPTVSNVATQTITSQPADTASPAAWRAATGK